MKFKFLYIGGRDLFSRHELGFIASLTGIGEVDVIMLNNSDYNKFTEMKRVEVISDNGIHAFRLFLIPTPSIKQLISIMHVISLLRKLNIENYDAIFATPRLPIIVASRISKGRRPTLLRLWSIKAAKLRDSIKFGAYRDITNFVPSILANAYYIAKSQYTITVDYATYSFARKFYRYISNKIVNIYPPYGYIKTPSSTIDREVFERINRLGEYVLGFTVLGKAGPYLKLEAKPQAIVLYRVAKRCGVNVILAGSTPEEFKRIFPGLSIPKNLHIIGKGFSDYTLKELYKHAKLVIIPISFRSISNRLLEALYFRRPIITSEEIRYLHPELIHKEHIYISNWDRIVDDICNLDMNKELLEKLEIGAFEAYSRLFSTKINALVINNLLKHLKV